MDSAIVFVSPATFAQQQCKHLRYEMDVADERGYWCPDCQIALVFCWKCALDQIDLCQVIKMHVHIHPACEDHAERACIKNMVTSGRNKAGCA